MSENSRLDPDFYKHLKTEISDGWRWIDRAVLLTFGALAGLIVVIFTYLSHLAYDYYLNLTKTYPAWIILIWTPIITSSIVWITKKYFPMAAGSGIPQVAAALTPTLDDAGRNYFVSIKLAFAKVILSSAGLLAGLSVGREGPSVQVAAGIMLSSKKYTKNTNQTTSTSAHSLLVAGGAAGIAAAFNAPLAGVVFAIEELSRKYEMKYSAVLIASIVLAGLIGVSAYGSAAYFGSVKVPQLNKAHIIPALLVALTCGIIGGGFSRLLITSLIGTNKDKISKFRAARPIAFAAIIGLIIAITSLITSNMTAGSGTEAVREILNTPEGAEKHFGAQAQLLGILKLTTTWLTTWSGVPGGLFAPSLSIGAGFGLNISHITLGQTDLAIVAMGMAGFLAAVTQAPLTSFIIVMEMIDGRPMVLSLMAVAMISASISRWISRPLYETLSQRMLAGLIKHTQVK